MTVVRHPEPKPSPSTLAEQPAGRRPRRWAEPVAGPVLIVAAVLVVLHGFWISPKFTNQQVDLLGFWFPRWCYLGTNLAHGHVPTWLPNQFGGVPFASDPQSGWLYLPVMLLFGALSCARAFGLFIVLQPVLAGLGMYWFLRHEGLGRPASTVGGLTLALSMSGSVVALSLPFAGMLAWTALSLAGASGFLHVRSAAGRLGWFAVTELSLSQIAAAHLTDGLLIGVGIVGLYVLARSIAQVRSGQRSPGRAVGLALLLFAAFPLLSAAVLVPRLALLPRTAIGHGYVELGRLANDLSGTEAPPPIYFAGVGPWWGTSFARGPGGYIGALGILLIPAALASRRWRWPVGAFALAGLAGWVLNLDFLISSRHIREFVLDHRVGELWLRSPYRFRYLLLVAFAALAGYGMQAWLDMRRAEDRAALSRRALWLGGPVLVFAAAPLAAGSSVADYVPFAIGLAYAAPLLLVLARGKWWPGPALPVLLAVELTVVGLVAQLGPIPRNAPDRLEQIAGPGLGHSFPKFHAPFIDPVAYLTPGSIGRTLIAARDDHGRYLSFNPDIAVHSPRGFLFHQDPGNWPAYENGRSILFGLDEAQGYSPVQLDRYWRLVRYGDREAPVFYNAATFQSVNPAVLRLFGVEWVVAPTGLGPPISPVGYPPTPAATEGSYTLWRLTDADPRASIVYGTGVVSPGGGLRTVTAPKFRPEAIPIVEATRATPPTSIFTSGDRVQAAGYHELTPEHVRMSFDAERPAILLVRNAWDPNWKATLDGRQIPVLLTDYVMQGVRVPAGRHVVELTYRDDAIGKGLLASAAAWALLFVVLGWLWRRRSRADVRTGA